jgi:hypothetical protein
MWGWSGTATVFSQLRVLLFNSDKILRRPSAAPLLSLREGKYSGEAK